MKQMASAFVFLFIVQSLYSEPATEYSFRFDPATNAIPGSGVIFQEDIETSEIVEISILVNLSTATSAEPVVFQSNSKILIQLAAVFEDGSCTYESAMAEPENRTTISAAFHRKVLSNKSRVIILGHYLPETVIRGFVSIRTMR